MLDAGLTRPVSRCASAAIRARCARLLDLDHRSRLDQLEATLAALGKRLVLEIERASHSSTVGSHGTRTKIGYIEARKRAAEIVAKAGP
jgi:hypothetical protein